MSASSRRFAVAALSIVTIVAACSDSAPPDTDASVNNDASKTPDVHVVDAVPDVPSDSPQVVDASDDAAPDAADASDDATDASDDATASDAAGDVVDMGDAADASSDDGSTLDASDDASDAAVLDAGSKGCKGIFCMLGHTCCNNAASVNYGKCELTTCTTCCM